MRMANAEYTRRLAGTRALMEGAELDGLLVSSPYNRRYLTGFTPGDSDITESSGWVLVTRHTLALIAGTFHLNGIEAEIEPSDARVLLTDAKTPADVLAAALGADGVRQLGFEKEWLSFDRYERIHAAVGSAAALVPSEDLVERVRARKDTAEIAAMRHAADIAGSAFVALLQRIQPGMTERQIAALLDRLMVERGASGPSFNTIVACGPGGALPHAIPGDREARVSEPLLLDFGCRVDGYCSDLTRTVCFGTPDAQLVKIYAVVRAAQDAALAALRAGARTGRAVDAAGRQVIEGAGYGAQFMHGLGHGVGLAVHELPQLTRLRVSTPELEAQLARSEVIPSNAVVTNEPGIYLAGWGGVRLEDMVLVGEQDVEVLTERNPEQIISIPVAR